MPRTRRTKVQDNAPGRFGSAIHVNLGLYGKPGDPEGFFRVSNDPLQHVGAGTRVLPGVPIFANTKIFNFVNALDVDTTNVWDETNVGTGTSLTVQDARGGKAKVTCGTADNNNYFYQSKYEIAGLVAGKAFLIVGSVEIADVDQADWFWGICERLASGNLFDNRVDAVGFYGTDGSANINCESKKTSATQSTNKGTLVDATEKLLGISIDGVSRVDFYIEDANGNLANVATITTNIPTDLMAVSFGVRNGQAAANSLTVGEIKLIQDK